MAASGEHNKALLPLRLPVRNPKLVHLLAIGD